MAYFYRRPNGVYYARIRVPDALRAVFGAPDLRRSLHTSDHALASRLALAAALEWKSEFQRLLMFDANKLLTGSPLLHTAGLISLGDAAQLIGLDVLELFLAAKTRRLMFCLMADGWMAADVPRAELISADPAIKTLNLDVGETLDGRELRPVFGVVYIRPNALAFVGEDGMLNDCLFFRDAARRHAVVMNMPGLTVPVNVLMLPRTDIEVLRQALAAKVLPTMLNQSISTSPAPTLLHSDQITAAVERGLMGEAYKHKEEPASVMLGAYYADKGAGWARATLDQNKRMCAVFVDLMGDPVLGLIDRELVKSYRSRLLGVPLDLHRVKARHPGVDLAGLIERASAEGLPVMDEVRADRHIAKIGEAFAWAARNGYMKDNPAAHLATGARTVKRKQDNRQTFDPAALGLIFGQPWFRDGRGELTKQGRYHTFQPFNYWMPLLGLFTGARLNELAQLYLKDVTVSEHGQWYLDFNLDGDGKIDADSSDQDGDASAGGKQLKTINSVRIVAMHPELVRLGLPDYVQRLRDAGHSRLFPELRRDEIKGYGKYAGQWFNERFLGKKLGLPRDGTQTFHSFRHTFLTACERLGMPDRVRDEMAGHSRGKGEGHATYIKDRSADEQAPHLNPLRFDLPVVAPFDVSEGLRALGDALSRKQRR